MHATSVERELLASSQPHKETLDFHRPHQKTTHIQEVATAAQADYHKCAGDELAVIGKIVSYTTAEPAQNYVKRESKVIRGLCDPCKEVCTRIHHAGSLKVNVTHCSRWGHLKKKTTSSLVKTIME
jgi:hypothetical protein